MSVVSACLLLCCGLFLRIPRSHTGQDSWIQSEKGTGVWNHPGSHLGIGIRCGKEDSRKVGDRGGILGF